MAMKYEYSNMEVGGYKICDRCGKRAKTNYGFYYSYRIPTRWGSSQVGLCRKCAAELEGTLTNFFYVCCEEGGTDFAESGVNYEV